MFVPIFTLLLCNIVLAYEGESLQCYDLEKTEEYFKWFVKTYEKSYSDKFEEQMRLEIFKENLKNINEKNAADEHAVFGITQFSDLTNEEFKLHYTGLLPFNGSSTVNRSSPFNLCKEPPFDLTYKDLPKNFDWRNRNIGYPVRNQRQCEASWAFAVTANVECLFSIYNAYHPYLLTTLSPQHLIDCVTDNSGCRGGNPWDALSYIVNNGIQVDRWYPYEGEQGKCRYIPEKIRSFAISGCFAGLVDEKTMQLLMYLSGPLIVGYESMSVKSYKGGILRQCRCYAPDSAALLVGYGEENGIPYWTLKNSWGDTWGEKGYFRIERGVNACCIREAPISSSIITGHEPHV